MTPLAVLGLQFVIPLQLKKKRLLLLVLFNPVVVLVLYYSVKPTVSFFNGEPTVIRCTYNIRSEPVFDHNSKLFVEYMDDDCDWTGYYYYTIDVNNAVTRRLVTTFGNPHITP